MAERGAVGRLFHAFANAVIARTLPTVREWLTSKLGPTASVDRMELDGSRVILREARLPIGPTAILEVDTATFLVNVGEGPPMRLERLEGRLTVPGPKGGLRFCAPLTLEAKEPPTGQEWVHGLVTVDGASWAASAGRDRQAPISGTVTATVTSSGWALTDGRATGADATIEISGSGRLDDEERGLERARLSTDDARVGHLLDAMFALAGRSPEVSVPLPWTGRCDGQVELDGGTVTAAFEVRTPASSLQVNAKVVSGEVEVATLHGALAWVDLVPASLLELVEESALVACEAELSGPFDALAGDVRLACDRVALTTLHESATVDARLALRGHDGAELGATVRLGGEAGGVELSAMMRTDGSLEGTLEGSVDPAVVDLGFGVITGNRIAIEGRVGGTRQDPSLDAAASSAHLAWQKDTSELALEQVTLTARHEQGTELEVAARLGSGTLRVDVLAKKLNAARIDGPSVVAVARSAGLDWLRAGGDPSELAPFAIPDDAEVDVELSYGDTLEGVVHLATSESRISLEPLSFNAGRWDGTILRGRLGASDALTCGLFPGPFKPLPSGAVTLELPLFGAGVETYVDGRVTTASLGWCVYDGAPPVTLSAAASGLRVDKEAVTLRGLEGRVFGGRAELDLRIAYPIDGEPMRTPTGRVFIDGARDGFGTWMEKLVGADRLPTGVGLDMELETGESGALRGPLVLSNQRSRLTLALSIGPTGDLEGTVLGGEISLSDVYELLPRGGPTVVGKGSVEVRAAVDGSVRAPEASVKLIADKPRLLFAGKGGGVRVALDRMLLRGRLNASRFVWRELVIDGYGGRVESQGLVGWGADGFSGMQAKVELDDLVLGSFPIPSGGLVGTLVTGRLSGKLTFRRPAGKGLSGKGQISLDKPVYPALNLAEPTLSKVGLRPPPIAGDEPALANLKGGPQGWILEGLGASVRGARVDGDLALKPGGGLLGALDVSLEDTYLRSSAMLRVPATMVGDVTLPVRLGGRITEPALEADLLGALDHMVQKSTIGRGIHRAVDTVMDGVLGERSPRSKREREQADDAALLPSDKLISRIARGTEDEDRYLDVLLERGLSPTEIADRIDAAQRT